ncbi:MAG: penicillin-insensitive murein DD-endopeptidase [Alphaproteobacteria bacterium]|jgi:penicillin-insensitive murein endopeptidase|nr:penicillin-insensitive murein DD-endopeptidase [Alphaproteobacteria bacterium]
MTITGEARKIGSRVPQARALGRAAMLALVIGIATAGAALAQDKGTLTPKSLPPLANPDDPNTPAKELFGRRATAAVPMESRTIGFYAKGCLAGGLALPIHGSTWQVMRLSRNRNWGHPKMVEFLERLSEKGAKAGWRGLLVGDMSQPRGGPMITGHASHQVGLDADIWLTPMPDRELTRKEREEMSATMVVAPDRKDVDPNVWTPAHFAIIKAAAQEPEVQRIFVNAAIKKALCREAGTDRAWLSKVRQYWQHDYHFHVRIRCPSDSPECKGQEPVPAGDGCGKDLDWWFQDSVLHPKPSPPPKTPPKPRPPITMKDLPPACRAVLLAP